MRSASLLAFVLLVPLAVSQEAKVVSLDWNDLIVRGDKFNAEKSYLLKEKYNFKQVAVDGIISRIGTKGSAWISGKVKRGDIEVDAEIYVSFASNQDDKAIQDAVAMKSVSRIVGDCTVNANKLRIDKAKLLK